MLTKERPCIHSTEQAVVAPVAFRQATNMGCNCPLWVRCALLSVPGGGPAAKTSNAACERAADECAEKSCAFVLCGYR